MRICADRQLGMCVGLNNASVVASSQGRIIKRWQKRFGDQIAAHFSAAAVTQNDFFNVAMRYCTYRAFHNR